MVNIWLINDFLWLLKDPCVGELARGIERLADKQIPQPPTDCGSNLRNFFLKKVSKMLSSAGALPENMINYLSFSIGVLCP